MKDQLIEDPEEKISMVVAALLLGVSRPTAKKMALEGKYKAWQVGGRIKTTRSAIAAYLATCEIKTETPPPAPLRVVPPTPLPVETKPNTPTRERLARLADRMGLK